MKTIKTILREVESFKRTLEFFVNSDTIYKEQYDELYGEFKSIDREFRDTANDDEFEQYKDDFGIMQVQILNLYRKINQDNRNVRHDSGQSRELSIPKLSPIQIKPFSGNITDWLRFRKAIETEIIKKMDDDDTKFQYLLSMLGERPYRMASTKSSFAAAWAALTDQYNDAWQLISAYLDKVLDGPECHNAKNLAQLIENLEGAIDAFEHLDIVANFTLFIRVIERKMNPKLRIEWLEQKQGLPTIEGLLDFLRLSLRKWSLQAYDDSYRKNGKGEYSLPNRYNKSFHREVHDSRSNSNSQYGRNEDPKKSDQHFRKYSQKAFHINEEAEATDDSGNANATQATSKTIKISGLLEGKAFECYSGYRSQYILYLRRHF